MRKLIALTAVAPLALIAACADNSSADTDEVAVEDMDMGLETQPSPAAYSPPSDNVAAQDYSGSYTFTGLDGSETTLTLNSEDSTYSYSSPGSTEPLTGSYSLADNRIEIADLSDDGPSYFSVSNDALYRLADDTRLYSDTDGSTIFVRAARGDDGVQSVAPDASVNSVADKRD